MPLFLELRRTFEVAHDFAEAGRLADGYNWLLEGLHEVEAEERQGRPWAEERIERYLNAMDSYIARWGVRMN